MKASSVKGLLPEKKDGVIVLLDREGFEYALGKHHFKWGWNKAIDQISSSELVLDIEELAKKLFEMHNYSRTFELNPKWEDLSDNSKDLSGFRWQARSINANLKDLLICTEGNK